MDTILKIDDLNVSYPSGFRAEKKVLHDINLELDEGMVFGLLGPNGAGKTTLIKSIVGLLQFQKGSIQIFGQSILSTSVKRRLGYMPEVANYYWFLTPEEILKLCGRLCAMDQKALASRIDHVLEIVDLKGEKRTIVRNFSKGMQGRLNIAQALLHDPDLFILDEPFSGLDPIGRVQVRNIVTKLKEERKTILFSSHELSEAELICDHMAIVKSGRIVKQGVIAELLAEVGEHSLEHYFFKIISGDHA